jgi:uncharacterized protein with HEPN domain
VKINVKEARRLMEALDHLRQAVAIAETLSTSSDSVRLNQLALERCIEIADEALQRESSFAAVKIETSLALRLSKLRYLIGRDYQMVDPVAIRETVLEVFPKLIRKIEPAEKRLYRAAELEPPPPGGSQ